MSKVLYRLKNIQKSFGEKKVLDISYLEISKGKFVSIVGYSGSGKSTLLNILGLLDKPDFDKRAKLEIEINSTKFEVSFDNKGKWLIKDGEKKVNTSNFRYKNIGFVFQDNYLPPHLKIDNLFKTFYDFKEINQKMKDVSLPEKFLDKYPFELSGGEVQRITILFAIAKNPLILLTDEPTSNLDYHIGKSVLKLFQSWLEKGNNDKRDKRTVIMVSHHLHQVCEFSDIIILLKDGKVIDTIDNSKKEITPDILTKKMI